MRNHNIAIVLLLLLSASCEKKDTQIIPQVEITDYIENFKLSQTSGGRVIWELKAKSAKFLSEGVAELSDVEVVFYSDSKKNTIIAKKGSVNQKTLEIETTGPTILKSKDKTVYTSDVKFTSSDGKIRTNKPTEIITGEARIKGSSMISDAQMESIVLTDQMVIWKK